MTSVLQPWVEEIPIRMQSTLLLGLRGPDTHIAPHLKTITRWLRGVTFKPGNPANVKEFMTSEPEEIVDRGILQKELDFCTYHYWSHLLHALEVVAYRHPSTLVSRIAFDRFQAMCNLTHVPVESPDSFEHRLYEVAWPGGKQPDTFEEAVAQLEKADELDRLRRT
jgi:hypothetical protein